MIRRRDRTELNDALPLIWKVFFDYEAVNYPQEGEQTFWDALQTEDGIQYVPMRYVR